MSLHPVVVQEHIGGLFLDQLSELLKITITMPVGITGDFVQAEVPDVSEKVSVFERVDAVDEPEFLAKLKYQLFRL
jgi:hypothetical protein